MTKVDRAAILAFDPRSARPHTIDGLGDVYLRSPTVRAMLTFQHRVSKLDPKTIEEIRKLEGGDPKSLAKIDPEALQAMIDTQGVLIASVVTDEDGDALFRNEDEAFRFIDRLPIGEVLQLVIAVVAVVSEVMRPAGADDDEGGEDPT